MKLFATRRDYLPKGSGHLSWKVDINGSTRVQDVLLRLRIPGGIAKIIVVNGTHRKKDQILWDGDVLSIFPVVAGG